MSKMRFKSFSRFISEYSMRNDDLKSPGTSSDSKNYLSFHSDSEVESYGGRSTVDNILNNIFDEQIGVTDISSSYCSSNVRYKSSEYSFDKRLKYWQSMLEERKRIADHLKGKTGKYHGEMLFNYMTTVDERDKNTIKRIFDYAERMNPITLLQKKPLVLPEICYCDNDNYMHLNQLQETLPISERQGYKTVEIIGLPAHTKTEILGGPQRRYCEPKSKWLESESLARGIQEKQEDIERVVDFYPDIEHLQVIGESYYKKNLQPQLDIKFLGVQNMNVISSDESFHKCECADKTLRKPKEIKPEYALLINDVIYKEENKSITKFISCETIFKCQPYHKVIKSVLSLKNIGRKTIDFVFRKRPYYYGVPDLLASIDDEFSFDNEEFRLAPDDERNVIIEYKPRKIGIFKEKYILKIDPVFFCNKCDSIFLKFIGVCRPCQEYKNKLKVMRDKAIEKSNLILLKTLTERLAELAPVIQPSEIFCPYKRELDERELFEMHNKGFKCERYHDLELLKEIYSHLKKPREPAWDLKVYTLKEKVLSIKDAELRSLTFAEFMGILEQMKGVPVSIESKNVKNPERDRARMIYVRGVICTAIDDWEELVEAIEESFLKTAIREHLEDLFEKENEDRDAKTNKGDPEKKERDERTKVKPNKFLLMNGEQINEMLLQNLKRNKSFVDALYIDTFTLLCNVIEDLVSVIESTEII